MRETIYTIPVNEAFDEAAKDGLCPFCHMKKRLESDRVAYTLGASMMEPDAREITNMTGFCDRHFDMLFHMPNKLSLALVLDTHLQSVRSRLETSKPSFDDKKSGLFKKKDGGNSVLSATIDSVVSGCAICNNINMTMERYIDVFFYMWDTDADFKKKFDACTGTCLVHFSELIKKSEKYLSASKAKVFAGELYEKQKALLDALQEDVHKFTLKFDYRNQDMPWGTAKDAPKRAIECLSGIVIDNSEEK